jgi:hypothetical protein
MSDLALYRRAAAALVLSATTANSRPRVVRQWAI